ncbi:hypothetical protein [Streptomyces sp. NPDC001930]|uniref:hypothetical protein n=1 Tax=Streptomyces sp. NPDC001930 TaxID=3364625 RepID=UPI0036A837C7
MSTRTGAAERTRLPGSAYAPRGTMVLQGTRGVASQAGITALTEELGAPAAFTVAVGAAVACALLSWTVRAAVPGPVRELRPAGAERSG